MHAEDILKYGHMTVLQSVEGLAQDDWDVPGVCGRWSVKAIVAHLSSYELLLADIARTFLDGGATPYLDQLQASPEQFNADQAAAWAHRPAAEVLAAYSAAFAQSAALVAQIPVETRQQASALPWYGAEYALDDLLVYMYYGHKREHCAQIAVFRDRIGR